MWIEQADVRIFVRTMAWDIIAEHAVDALNDFDTALDRYMAPPALMALNYHLSIGKGRITPPPPLSVTVAVALVAVLDRLIAESEAVSVLAPRASIRRSLMRLLLDGQGGPGAAIRIRPARHGVPEQLALVFYCSLLPIAVSVPTYALHELMQTIGEQCGLNEAERINLGMAILLRLCRHCR